MKACPFCGGRRQYLDSITVDEKEQFFYCCLSCQAEGPVADDEVGALQAWETRSLA